MYNRKENKMDYKEKYEQALENLNKIKNANKDNKALVDFIEYKYPELKENGDEKIRNWLIDTIKQIPNDSIEWEIVNTKIINKENVVAWLEKQGKQIPIKWTEEDEKIKREIEVILANTNLSKFALKYTFSDIISWFKSLKERIIDVI